MIKHEFLRLKVHACFNRNIIGMTHWHYFSLLREPGKWI
jgi:hypothetical protein